MAKLSSRKFWMAGISILTSIVAMLSGAISPELGMKIILGAVVTYSAAEGGVDIGRVIGQILKK